MPRTLFLSVVTAAAFWLSPNQGLHAQQGPSPEVEAAVQSVVRLLESRDPESLTAFIDGTLSESYRSQHPLADLVEHFESLRQAARGGTSGIDLMRDPAGLILQLENGVRILIELDESAKVEGLEQLEADEGVIIGGPPEPIDLELDDDWTSLGDLLAEVLQATGAPGVAAAVVKGGRIVASAASGTRVAGGDAPFRTGDRFHWGSVGKSATGTVIGALMASGKLSPETTVAEVLPTVPMRDEYRNVTLAQLMRHEGGVQPYTNFESATIDRFAAYRGTAMEKRDAFVRDLLMEPPVHAPGERFEYSNGGVSLAGHMAEVVAGRSWEELVREFVFEPAGMSGAAFGLPATEATPDQTRGHFMFGPGEPEVVPIGDFSEIDPMIAPAGGISSSIDDFARYAAFHLRGIRDGAGAMSAADFGRVHTADPESWPVRNGLGRYAWGWEFTDWPVPGVETHWHNGSGGMFYAEVRLFPEEDLGIVVMSNAGGPIAFSGDQIVRALYRRFGDHAVPARGSDVTWETLPATLADLERTGFSGVVLARRGGREVLREAYGMADRDLGRTTSPDLIYGIGSGPVGFTRTAAFLLASRGQLDLDASISSYIDGVPQDKHGITPQLILDGKSGLPDFHHVAGDWDPDLAWIDRETALQRILSQPLLFEPGSEEAHSHSAYGLLAVLIERVSQRSYQDFVRSEILDPLGMDNTGFYGESLGRNASAFAVGYGPSAVGAPNIPPNWGPTSWLVMGSGGMFSSLDDMIRYHDARAAGELLPEAWAQRDRPSRGTVDGSDRGFFGMSAANQKGDLLLILSNDNHGLEVGPRPLMRPLMSLVLEG